jgi:hypothetical protein
MVVVSDFLSFFLLLLLLTSGNNEVGIPSFSMTSVRQLEVAILYNPQLAEVVGSDRMEDESPE